MGGFGEYFDIDPVILRVIYAGVSIFTAIIPGIIAYLIAALLMPNAPHTFHRSETDHHKTEHDQKTHETPEV